MSAVKSVAALVLKIEIINCIQKKPSVLVLVQPLRPTYLTHVTGIEDLRKKNYGPNVISSQKYYNLY